MSDSYFLLDVLTRNWALVAIVTTVTALVAIPLIVLYSYVRIALNIMRSTKPPLGRNPLDYEPIEGEPVQFNAYDGLTLEGMILRGDPDRPRRGTVIFAHEYCSDMSSCARYCRPLLQVGYDVFAFDFRGHGKSAGQEGYEPRQWVTDREVADMRGALAYVDRWLTSAGLPREVGVVGVSRGAGAAVIVTAESPQVQALVCDGLFDTRWTVEFFLRRWAAIFAAIHVIDENGFPRFWRAMGRALLRAASREFRCRFPSVRKALTGMRPRPIIFIHGERDSYLPVEQSRLLYALAPQPKALWIAPRAKHNQAAVVHPERYAAMIIRLFDEHLAGRTDAHVTARATDLPAPPVALTPTVDRP